MLLKKPNAYIKRRRARVEERTGERPELISIFAHFFKPSPITVLTKHPLSFAPNPQNRSHQIPPLSFHQANLHRLHLAHQHHTFTQPYHHPAVPIPRRAHSIQRCGYYEEADASHSISLIVSDALKLEEWLTEGVLKIPSTGVF